MPMTWRCSSVSMLLLSCRGRDTPGILQVVAQQVTEGARAHQRPQRAHPSYRTMVDIDVGWAHLVPGGLRELDEHLGRAARVDDLEVAADAPEQACGTPTIQGVATSVEHYIPLIHGVCFLVASLS